MSLLSVFLASGIILVIALIASLIFRQLRMNRHSQDFLALQQRFDNLQTQFRQTLDGNTQIFQQQMGLLTKQLDERLKNNTQVSHDLSKGINERMDNAARVFGELQNRLGQLGEANEKIYNIGKDIKSLQEILRNPKARGGLGELLLEHILSEMFPRDRFQLQYCFKNNEKVDAVIFAGDQLIPIDSKFPLENFKRINQTLDEDEKVRSKKQFVMDVKKHIEAISKKYILPEEGTFDFAFMYIPAENVFYEVIVRDDDISQGESLQTYALRKRVIPVSPNSFYAYLVAFMQALRGERMQHNIVEITSQIRHLNVELAKFRGDFDKIGFHLNNLRGSYEASDKRLNRYQDRIEKIQSAELVEKDLQTNKPSLRAVVGTISESTETLLK